MLRAQSKVLWLVVALTFLTASAGLAQGSLMINPKRIVLSDRHRSDNITLFNSGSDTASFLISLIHYEMREDGSLEQIPDSVLTYRTAYCDSLIRYFPMEVTLGPRESQAIHVRFLKPMNLAKGEYRSHMYFRTLERAQPVEQTAQDTLQHTISLDVRPIFGLSIPIIVRSNTEAPILSIDSLHVSSIDTDGNGTISALLRRSGNESCYGSLAAFYKDRSGVVTPIGILKGIAVYPPLTARTISISFKIPAGVDPGKGIFRLEYQTLTDNSKEQVLASTETREGRR